MDLGCGKGDYLSYLQEKGCIVYGSDESKSAIGIAKKIIKNNRNLKVGDMFQLIIPKNRFDYIISIAAMQHGKKEKIAQLIVNIHGALKKGGKTFITLPSMKNSRTWISFRKKKIVASGVCIPLSGPEKGLVHSFFSKKELSMM